MKQSIRQSVFVWLVAAATVYMSACRSDDTWDKESQTLHAEAIELNKQHRLLNQRIDSLWDATAIELAASLPPDFPAIDRDIFIKARNADHIRMFMSYQALREDTKALVNAAGKYDEMLAKHVLDLQWRQEKFEAHKTQFLTNVFHHDPEAGQRFAAQFRMASETNEE
jgi:hypothetical protein